MIERRGAGWRGNFVSRGVGKIANWFGRRKKWRPVFIAVAILTGALFLYSAYVGAPPVVYRDGLYYVSMRPDAPWLPYSVRAALATPAPHAEPGKLVWRKIAPGLELGELPVLFGKREVDRLYLTRIDPAQYEFRIRVDPNKKDLKAWMRDLRPVAVINGSYYNAKFGPATPVLIDGAKAGPAEYQATHGAFVSSESRTALVDLAATNWRDLDPDAKTMLVSYPTLLDAEGGNRRNRRDGSQAAVSWRKTAMA